MFVRRAREPCPSVNPNGVLVMTADMVFVVAAGSLDRLISSLTDKYGVALPPSTILALGPCVVDRYR